MSPSGTVEGELSDEQQRLVDDLHGEILRFIEGASSQRDVVLRSRSPGRGAGRVMLPCENVFGIIGSRGQGKSTLLRELDRKLRASCGDRAPQDRALILPAIDCFAVPMEITAGVVILDQLCAALEGECPHHARDVLPSLLDEFRHVGQVQMGMSSHVNQLAMETASSTMDYTHHLFRSVGERLHLQERLAEALDHLHRATGYQTVVALLEDFDLVPGELVRRWFRALLDEFQQHRIAIVITADLHRLEHLSLDKERQVDDRTGRAIIKKLLPEFRQFRVPFWHPANCQAYVPMEKPEGKKFVALLDVCLAAFGGPTLRDSILALLPDHPRGMRSFWYYLHRTGTPPEFDALMANLAYARREALFARRLHDLQAPQLLRKLEFVGVVTPEVWRETVQAATLARGEVAAPLTALRLRASMGSNDVREAEEEAALRHDPNWEDPLRNDFLHLAPLRDTDERAHPHWLELLIDRAWQIDERTRTELLVGWGVLQRRIKRARFRVPFSREELAAELHSLSGPITRLLPWIAFVQKTVGDDDLKPGNLRRGRDDIVLDIGWSPLFESLRGGRSWWPAELIQALYLDPERLLGSGTPTSETAGGTSPRPAPVTRDLLPRRLRAMVLFVDALDRCPWDAYVNLNLGWPLALWLRLAVSFVRASYLDAIRRTRPVDVAAVPNERESLASAPKEGSLRSLFFEQLQRPDPILGRGEVSGTTRRIDAVTLEAQLRAFQNEPHDVPDDGGHPLQVAARAFFASDVYLGLDDLDGVGPPP